MKSVSIVIPVYNRAEYLASLFRSLEAITYPDLRIILVDNNSKDDSLSLCRDFASRTHLHVSVLTETNPGAAFARNKGLAACETEWVYFFDSDDILSEDFLDILMPLSENKDAIFLSVRQQIEGQGIKVHDFCETTNLLDRDGRCSSSKDAAYHIISSMLCTPSMLLRTEWLRQIGGWNGNLRVWDDFELGFRVLLNKPRYTWYTKKSFHHIVVHKESITSDSMSSNFSGKLGCLRAILSSIELPRCDFPPSERFRLQKALYLRAMIFQGQIQREGSRDSVCELFSDKPLSKGIRVWGNILRLYTKAGGRGAWRMACFGLKFLA